MRVQMAAISLATLMSSAVLSDPWTGKGELGYVLVDGNTESESLNVGLEFLKKHENWTHKAKLSAVRASTDNVESAESATAGWRSEYSFSERAYTFGDFRYFEDEFDSFSPIYTAAFGIGYKIIMEEDQTWDVSAGLGYRDTEIELTEEDVSGVAYLLESNYIHALTENTDFENYTRVEITEENTFSQNKASLKVAMNEALALKVTYEVRHNSDPEPSFKSVDRITSVNIVYSF